MKSLKELWTGVLEEMGTLCSVSTTRDLKTVSSRFEHEGLSFLTITLPAFGKDFQKSLDLGVVGHDRFVGFKRTGGLPRFLGGFLDRVFDRGTGRLLDVPCIDSIFAIRQLTLMMEKIELDCSEERNARAIQRYLECESDVRKTDRTISPDLLREFKRMSVLLFGDVLASLDRAIDRGEVKPRHGPGATADRLRGNAKFDLSEWTTRMEGIFPFGEYALPSWRYYYRLEAVDFREPGRERPVRVKLVPKTLKTPRIIAYEPTCMQYMQQAVMEKMIDLLETDPTISGMVGFLDQSVNQTMAKKGSEDGSLATLDLAEASDRVSNQHVRLLCSGFPHLDEAVQATRSRKADVPGKGIIRLAKFASMGSALCFPVEAMVFTTIAFLGIQEAHRRRLTRNDIKSYLGRVRIYGDDIIVPVELLQSVIAHLEAFGLKVNGDKTFGTGKFRESCGRDYYDGVDVTPVRVRQDLPSSRSDVRELIALVSLRNRLYEAGFWKTVALLDPRISTLLRGRYPRVAATSAVLGRLSYLGYDTEKLHPSLHAPRVRGHVITAPLPRSRVSGEGALLKWFLKRGDEPFADRDHLERSGRPDAVSTKLRWASPF